MRNIGTVYNVYKYINDIKQSKPQTVKENTHTHPPEDGVSSGLCKLRRSIAAAAAAARAAERRDPTAGAWNDSAED